MWCCHDSLSSFFFSFFYRAGVGSAMEGGRGRAGTKLFQDFQMLSRIWTHPWCLQLDYISKENKVSEQRHTSGELQASLPSSALKQTQGNAGVSSQSSLSACSQSYRTQQSGRKCACPTDVTRRQVLYFLCCSG